MVTKEEQPEAPEAPTTMTLHPGSFVEMRSGRWYRCTDLNRRLDRFGVTKIGAVLEKAEVDVVDGGDPEAVKTFTLRQFYQSGRPTLDFTPESLTKTIKDAAKWLGAQRGRDIEAVLRPACKLFEEKYKGWEADLDQLRNVPVLGV